MTAVSSDHDLLIRLDEKVTNLTVDIKLLNDGVRERLRDVETRLTVIEKLNPIELANRFFKTESTVNRIQWIIYTLWAVGAIMMWTSGFFNNLFSLFRR